MKKRDLYISGGIVGVAVLAFALYTGGTGRIQFDAPGGEIMLTSGLFGNRMLESSSEPVEVKARVYRTRMLTITGKDQDSTWRLTSYAQSGSLSKISVKRDETTVVKAGPPFTVKPEVSPLGSASFSIGYSIVGCGGEVYNADITRNGRQVPAPALRIVDESGKVLANGKFEYG